MIWVLVTVFAGLAVFCARRPGKTDPHAEMAFIYALLAVVFGIIGLVKLVQS